VRTHQTWIWAALLSTVCSCATAPQRASTSSEVLDTNTTPLVQADALAPSEPAAAPQCERPPRPLSDDGVFYVQSSEPASPRVRYLDGQVSLNDSCAIRRGSKLSRRVPPMYVNGKPVGFC